MHNQSYKFCFLISWCFLLSLSIVIMVAVIGSNQKETQKEQKNSTGGGQGYEYLKGCEQKSVDYIHLVSGKARNDSFQWKKSVSFFFPNTSLHLQNDSVIINTAGFYHIYAQVTIMISGEYEGTVTLVANENVPGKNARKLSEATLRYGTVSMSGVFYLSNGDSMRLLPLITHHSTSSVIFSMDVHKTYWGLILLVKK